MPAIELALKGSRGDPPLKVYVGEANAKGEVEVQFEQLGQIAFVECGPEDWARIIDAIQANLKEAQP